MSFAKCHIVCRKVFVRKTAKYSLGNSENAWFPLDSEPIVTPPLACGKKTCGCQNCKPSPIGLFTTPKYFLKITSLIYNGVLMHRDDNLEPPAQTSEFCTPCILTLRNIVFIGACMHTNCVLFSQILV